MIFCLYSLMFTAYGKETSVQLNNLTSDGVLQAMEKLVTSEAF